MFEGRSFRLGAKAVSDFRSINYLSELVPDYIGNAEAEDDP